MKRKMSYTEMAKKNMTEAYYFIVGGYENSVSDGGLDEMPPVEDMFNEVFTEGTTTRYMPGLAGGRLPVGMRSVSREILKQHLVELFRKGGYSVDFEQKESKPKASGAANHLHVEDGEELVTLHTFTGMIVGTYNVVSRKAGRIHINSVKGPMEFDASTGKQLNAKDPRYANYIDV